jgi:hypothetical protein
MRTRTATIPESAAALHQRLQQGHAPKQRQRVQARSRAARGHARSRQAVADLLGVPRPSVAAWLEASAAGGWRRGAATRSRARPAPPSTWLPTLYVGWAGGPFSGGA